MVMYCDICGAKLENGELLTECPECLCSFENADKLSNIKEFKSKVPDGLLIKQISTDESFADAMFDLYQKDPIEYQLKIQQFKNQLQQQEQLKSEPTRSLNQRKCRYCGSTSFTPVKRKWTPIMGFLTNKTDLVCNNCGKKVQWIDM